MNWNNFTLTGDRLTMTRSLAVARVRRLRVDNATLVDEATAAAAAAAAACLAVAVADTATVTLVVAVDAPLLA